MIKSILLLLFLLQLTIQYIEIPLQLHSDANNSESYSFEMVVDKQKYNFYLSLENKDEFYELQLKEGAIADNQYGEIQLTSLEGYSFEGWKRYFLDVLLYVQQRYHHTIMIDLKEIKRSAHTLDKKQFTGLATFGPNQSLNRIYKQIRTNSKFASDDIIAIYRGVRQNKIHLQIGGYQESLAKGHQQSGRLFNEVALKNVSNLFWGVDVFSIQLIKTKNNTPSIQKIKSPFISLQFKISIQNSTIILPQVMQQSVQSSLFALKFDCQFKPFLTCKKINGVQTSLTHFTLYLQNNLTLNISLHSIVRSYIQATDQTEFNLKFGKNEEIQIGTSILKEYYLAFNFKDKKLLYSPLNHFGSSNYSVYFLRFCIYFTVFLFLTAIGAALYQLFNDPYKRNKIQFRNGSFEVISWESTAEFEE